MDEVSPSVGHKREPWPNISNLYIKSTLENIAQEGGFALIVPPSKYCTDNGAMIAWAGIEHRLLGVKSDYAFDAKARWSLEGLNI